MSIGQILRQDFTIAYPVDSDKVSDWGRHLAAAPVVKTVRGRFVPTRGSSLSADMEFAELGVGKIFLLPDPALTHNCVITDASGTAFETISILRFPLHYEVIVQRVQPRRTP